MDEELLQVKAKELIEIKRKINELSAIEQAIKNEIKPMLKEHGPVKFDSGRVYYLESKGAETFRRKAVLEYLRESYGEALANQVDLDCTKHGEPKQAVFVKLSES